jgi:hypothetical protein
MPALRAMTRALRARQARALAAAAHRSQRRSLAATSCHGADARAGPAAATCTQRQLRPRATRATTRALAAAPQRNRARCLAALGCHGAGTCGGPAAVSRTRRQLWMPPLRPPPALATTRALRVRQARALVGAAQRSLARCCMAEDCGTTGLRRPLPLTAQPAPLRAWLAHVGRSGAAQGANSTPETDCNSSAGLAQVRGATERKRWRLARSAVLALSAPEVESSCCMVLQRCRRPRLSSYRVAPDLPDLPKPPELPDPPAAPARRARGG